MLLFRHTAITNNHLRRAIIGVTTLFILLGIIYSIMVPAWEVPDEPSHVKYARYLRDTLRLPRQQAQGSIETSHHPPLYYILAVLASAPANWNNTQGSFRLNPKFIWHRKGGHEANIHQLSSVDTFPYSGVALALHLMRLLSVTCSAGTVVLTYLLAREIFPNRPSVVCLAAILVAFNPQFLFISAGALNDGLMVMAATGAMWQMLRAVRQPVLSRQWVYVGVWSSVAALAKISGIVLIPLSVVLLLVCAVFYRNMRILWRGGLAFAVPVLTLTGWWFARNIWLYGDPFGTMTWGKRFPEAAQKATLRLETFLGPLINEQFRSFWGVFGWMTVAAPPWFFFAIRGLLLISALGLIGYIIMTIRNAKSVSRREVFGVLFCAAVVVLMQGLMIRENLRFVTATQGRYLFPVIAPFMTLVSLGLHSLIPARVRKPALIALTTLYLSAALYMPFGVVAPNYPMLNTLPRRSLWFAANKVNYTFGNTFGLRSYEVKRMPDGDLQLRLIWVARQRPPFDYSSFAHVYAAQAIGLPLAQQDQSPGINHQYPPSAWSEGDIVADERILKMKQPLPNGVYEVRLGVYNYQTGERLSASKDAQPAGDSIVLPFAWPPP